MLYHTIANAVLNLWNGSNLTLTHTSNDTFLSISSRISVRGCSLHLRYVPGGPGVSRDSCSRARVSSGRITSGPLACAGGGGATSSGAGTSRKTSAARGLCSRVTAAPRLAVDRQSPSSNAASHTSAFHT